MDDVRHLQRVAYAEPWEGTEGERQYRLGIRNACAPAQHFDADGSDVVLVDVAPPHTLPLYREGLRSADRLSIVLLHADADVLIERDTARGGPSGREAPFWHGRIRELRDELVAHADDYDHAHHTGEISAEQSAAKLAVLLGR